MSASAFFLSASSTNTHCQPWALDPVGACSANSRHSISTSRGTGFSRSSRLRTERVVVRTSSTDRFEGHFARLHSAIMTAELTQEVSSRLTIRPLRLADHRGQVRPAGPASWSGSTSTAPTLIVYTMPNAAKVRHINRPSAGEPEPGLRRQRRRHHRGRRQRDHRRRGVDPRDDEPYWAKYGATPTSSG